MNDTPLFQKIEIKHWRQFDHVQIDVHPQLTILTGSNGAGKSTILNIFSQHFGYQRAFLGTPKLTKTGIHFYDIGLHRDIEVALDDKTKADMEEKFDLFYEPTGNFVEFGSIDYTNGMRGGIGLYEQHVQAYTLQIQNQQHVAGVNIGSHRLLTNYQPVQNITLQPMRAVQAYSIYNQEILNRFAGGHTGYSPIYRMKEALISMAAFGEGNSYLQANKEVLDIFLGFIDILKMIMPEEIGFISLLIRIPDVVLQTRSGDFLLDSSSGGVNAIIEIAWQIYLYSRNQMEEGRHSFAVTIDEPENHLHPSMQRAILPNLIAAFPQAQFIVATHSPFVVSAVENSSVYVLNYTGKEPSSSSASTSDLPSKRRVSSVKLDNLHKGGTAGEILREVLGVPVTIPKWVQDRVDTVIASYKGRPITNDLLNSLRKDLSSIGLGELYPDALSRLVGK